MVGNIFPYEQIEKNSDIILWGAGKVCREFRFQIEQTGYCNIVGIVDSNAQESYGEVHSIDFLEDKEFEYIVITIENEKVANALKELLENRYPQASIITIAQKVKEIIANISTKELQDQTGWERLFLEYDKYGLGNFSFFQSLIVELKQSNEKMQIKDVVKRCIDNWTLEQQMIAMRLLLLGNCFDSELMRMYHAILEREKNKELVIGLLYETSAQSLMNPDYRYPDYYLDRREVIRKSVEQIVSKYSISVPFQRKCTKEIKRICFLRQNLPSYTKSAASKFVINYANEAFRSGYEVLIISYNFFDDIHIRSYMNFALQEEFDVSGGYIEDGVLVHKTRGNSLHDRIQDVLNTIHVFSPDLIISTCSYYEIMTSILYRYFPTIAISFGGYSSSSYFHRYLTKSKELFAEANAIYRSVDEKKMRELKSLCVPLGNSDRKEYRDKSSFICATVGNRLDVELTQEFIDGMAKWLDNHNGAQWILVGRGEFAYIKKTYKHLIQDKKVILWGYADDLNAFYATQDIRLLIYPKVLGNGTTAVLAIKNHIPVIMSKTGGDMEMFLKEWGVIPGQLEHLFIRLEELTNDEDELKNIADGELDICSQFLTCEQYTHELIKIGYEILEEF